MARGARRTARGARHVARGPSDRRASCFAQRAAAAAAAAATRVRGRFLALLPSRLCPGEGPLHGYRSPDHEGRSVGEGANRLGAGPPATSGESLRRHTAPNFCNSLLWSQLLLATVSCNSIAANYCERVSVFLLKQERAIVTTVIIAHLLCNNTNYCAKTVLDVSCRRTIALKPILLRQRTNDGSARREMLRPAPEPAVRGRLALSLAGLGGMYAYAAEAATTATYRRGAAGGAAAAVARGGRRQWLRRWRRGGGGHR